MSGAPLAAWGWSAARAEEAHAADVAIGCVGRVISPHRLGCLVATERGLEEAVIKGRYRREVAAHRAEEPVVGDWVHLSPAQGEEPRLLSGLLPRQNQVVRKAAGQELKAQTLAANVDVGFVVDSVAADLRPSRLERFLAMLRDGGVTPVLVLTKRDLATELDRTLATARELAGGAAVLAISSVTGEGLSDISSHLVPGHTCGLFGPSGVGKSSLINRLLGNAAQATGAVDEFGRGRHTTSHRELVQLPGGALLLDMPGIRELELWEAENLDDTFDDVAEVAAACRFRDCRHQREPGCAVQAALGAGLLGAARVQNWQKLQAEGSARRTQLRTGRR